MKHSLEKGMQCYLTSPTWKSTMDFLQFTYQCCGVNDYKDWHQLTWLDRFHIDVTSEMVKE